MNSKTVKAFIILFFIMLGIVGLPRRTSAMMQVPDWLLPQACCSNVIFLPGLEASRLYKDSAGFFGTSTDKLWEPHRNDNVRALFLNADGVSNDSSIYTKDIVDTAHVLGIDGDKIYQSFVDTLDELVDENKIHEWRAYPYDWRQDVADIVKEGIHSFKQTQYLVDEVVRLAGTSQTQKVTIIAHSNGGLLAKALIQELEQQGKTYLIDKVIFVAVPEIGTPSAIAALLHGYDQALGSGWLQSAEVARIFGENMPSAYGLLPSDSYFGKVSDSVIQFSTSTPLSFNFIQKYGSSIDSREELVNFITGKDGRMKPVPSDLLTPNVLNSKLVDNAEENHTSWDNWQPPSSIDFTEFAGWGMKTLKAVEYDGKKKEVCPLAGVPCQEIALLDPKPLFSYEGDQTVLYPSAMSTAEGEHYFINLDKYNKDTGTSNEHKDILESAPLLTAISKEITNTPSTSLESEYISKNKPDIASIGETMELEMHSPASINLYDAYGNHTGPIPNPDPDSDFELYEEKIPNSYYTTFAESVYAGFPIKDGNTVKIQGTGTGTFTFDVARLKGDTKISAFEFADVPVTPQLKATLAVSSTSTAPALSIDVDGDGTTDVVATTSPSADPYLYLHILEKTIDTLDMSSQITKRLHNKIERIMTLLDKNKKAKAITRLTQFSHKLATVSWKQKKLTADQKKILGDMVTELLDSFD